EWKVEAFRKQYGFASSRRAAHYYHEAAAHGDPETQYELATRLLAGKGVTRDRAGALQWFRKAAIQGHAESQYRLGQLETDPKQAVCWLQKAAENGSAEALVDLGTRYLRGNGVSRDEAEAARLFLRAADLGH